MSLPDWISKKLHEGLYGLRSQQVVVIQHQVYWLGQLVRFVDQQRAKDVPRLRFVDLQHL